MLTVAEAIQAILSEVERSCAVDVPLADALGLVLAQDAHSDLDSPPFDKALMDGYAVRADDVQSGHAQLQLLEEVTAGQLPRLPVGPGETTCIMTGAPLPSGADAVVRIEETRSTEQPGGGTVIHIQTRPICPGQDIMHRGTTLKKGTRVLAAGRRLRAQEIGALAELGNSSVAVFPRPRVAILATGNELVPLGQLPGPGQIRNSNEAMLCAQVTQAGSTAVPLGIARDEREQLRERILAGLQYDVLLLSGGVSAGKLDLVPSELKAAGVRCVFHKVQLKPGKPIWFGVADRRSDNTSRLSKKCYVFGLPGNPVSSMVCFELFVRTVLRRRMGITPAQPVPVQARLAQEHCHKANRPTYHPAHLEERADGRVVRPIAWHGSADLFGSVQANCMVHFPAGDRAYSTAAVLDVYPW